MHWVWDTEWERHLVVFILVLALFGNEVKFSAELSFDTWQCGGCKWNFCYMLSNPDVGWSLMADICVFIPREVHLSRKCNILQFLSNSQLSICSGFFFGLAASSKRTHKYSCKISIAAQEGEHRVEEKEKKIIAFFICIYFVFVHHHMTVVCQKIQGTYVFFANSMISKDSFRFIPEHNQHQWNQNKNQCKRKAKDGSI